MYIHKGQVYVPFTVVSNISLLCGKEPCDIYPPMNYIPLGDFTPPMTMKSQVKAANATHGPFV